MLNNRKGFTLVELLAVVVVLGILTTMIVPNVNRWINRGKSENLEGQKRTLVMSTQSYVQKNASKLPKLVGEGVKISAKELKSSNFLNSDIIDGSGKSCMDKSYVYVYKESQTGYTYTPYVYCGADVVPQEDPTIKPGIKITFTDELGNSNYKENVSIALVRIEISDRQNASAKSVGLASYRYIISVSYTNPSDNCLSDQRIEVFNSTDINAHGESNVVIEKKLSDYVDVTKVSNFKVSVEAYNRDGGQNTVIGCSDYMDVKVPICGVVTGQAGLNQWNINGMDPVKISVACIDGNGSGCVKDTYTKTFKDDTVNSTITIKDKKGLVASCGVVVHIDHTNPVIQEVSSTNNFASQQTVTFKMKDNIYLGSYYIGQVNPASSNVSYTAIGGNLKEYTTTKVIDSNHVGTWYFSVKDVAGNVTTVSKVIYKTTLIPQNGTLADPKIIVTFEGKSFTLPKVTAYTGYTFKGWYTEQNGGGTQVAGANGGNTLPNTTRNLYGWCSPNTYTINYAMNGGVKGIGATTGTYDANVVISKPTKNYVVNINTNSQNATLSSLTATMTQVFAGWSASGINTTTAKYGIASNAVNTAWSNGETKLGDNYETLFLKNLTPTQGASVTLTANWVPLEVTLPSITKTGYTCGYATSSVGTIAYNGGASLPASATAGSTTIFARCNPNTYTVYFNYNGGNCDYGNKTVTYDSNYSSLPNCSRGDHSFNGWYTNSSGGSKIDSGTTVKITSSQTLYAQWTYNPPHSDDGGGGGGDDGGCNSGSCWCGCCDSCGWEACGGPC